MKMEDLNFEDFDSYLLKNESKIIHQIWFGTIPNKNEAGKALKKLKTYKDSWINKNPRWLYVFWSLEKCKKLIKTFYPQHLEMYNNYPYTIQRCDSVRYFILHRYGGLYADMDYFCNKSWEKIIHDYKQDFYLVETPNKTKLTSSDSVHISNSLMYSKKNHIFWNHVFVELELSKSSPVYYSRHVSIMFTTGPGFLNRIFNKYRIKYKLGHYPYKLFHPYGLDLEIKTLSSNPNINAVHLGKGSWETFDSKILIFFYQEYVILMIILITLSVTMFIQRLLK
jgi:inositol phosphorylceramide mannosyltransferase catalytic subunit